MHAHSPNANLKITVEANGEKRRYSECTICHVPIASSRIKPHRTWFATREAEMIMAGYDAMTAVRRNR